MAFVVIDYSEVYFQVLNQSPIPPRRAGRFVLITNRDDEYAVFSPQELSRYHANIVERFLSLRGIPGRYNSKQDHYKCLAADWRIEGGGFWELDEECGILRLSGRSQAYGGVDLPALAARLRDAGGVGGCLKIAVL